MNPASDPKRDELRDRLMDQALRELLAGETPPDLSDRILAAVEKPTPVSLQRKDGRMGKFPWRNRWVLGGVAACLLVGVTIGVLMSTVRHASIATRWGENIDPATPRLHGIDKALDSATPRPSPYYMEDDVKYDPAPASGELAKAANALQSARLASKTPSSAASRQVADQPAQYLPDQSGGVPVQTLEKKLEQQGPGGPSSPAGQGPGMGGDRYDRVVETGFVAVKDQPLSTFSIDVDTASYANVRRFLLESGQLPPPDAVRIEELVNYFDYDYAGPEGEVPFAAHLAVAGCPWQPEHRLVRIGLKGKEIPEEERPQSNLVFLLDVSGSMNSPDKLPLLKAGMKLLAEQMRENDRVAIVVYAGSEGLVLPSTPGAQREKILAALEQLEAGGSTNGGAGIELAYRIAQENFLPKGTNRVVLCTDGDFNVGTTSTGDLTRTVEEKARSGVFLSVLGFGRGNLNDAMMETISNKGNGNYAYVDSLNEARKVLVEQMGGTLITIAKDVKIQVEFNPARVAAYRLIGYENRALAAQDFNDDRKDAGEIGAGHTVTALYELVPVGVAVDASTVDPLKYQPVAEPKEDNPASEELLTLKLRYKAPDADTSQKLEFPLADQGTSFNQADADFQFAAAVASFGMLLRDSQYKGTATYGAVLEIATSAKGSDLHGYRAEFLEMVRRAQGLSGR